MDKRENITNLQAVKGGKRETPIADALRGILHELPAQLEMYEVVAKCRRKYFEELIKEGFTEEQAMEIVKTTNI